MANAIGRLSRFLTVHRWVRTVLVLAMTVPLVTAVRVALTGRQSGLLSTALLGAPGLVVVLWLTRSGGWDLTPAQRGAVWDATRTGVANGDRQVDAVAGYQLEQASRPRTAAFTFVAMTGVVVAASVVAAVRTGSETEDALREAMRARRASA